MTQYVKVTLKEFKSMQKAVESSLEQSGCWDNDDQLKEINKAGKAAKAIEIRNGLNNDFNYDEYIY